MLRGLPPPAGPPRSPEGDGPVGAARHVAVDVENDAVDVENDDSDWVVSSGVLPMCSCCLFAAGKPQGTGAPLAVASMACPLPGAEQVAAASRGAPSVRNKP